MAGNHEKQQFVRTIQLKMPPSSTVDIEFRDITMRVSKGFRTKETKTILKGLSGNFNSGELTAILGPSGAGKSSLLNALTGFSTNGVTGTIQAGDSTCVLGSQHNSLNSLGDYTKKSCYILQDDRLNPLFTVAELMKFSADLKLGTCVSDKNKQTVIAEILETLSLTGTENTRCGSLSGGQRKRLSVAVELIDNPPVIYLDEPTTGLDSSASTQCMELLKSLARDNRTIICTIHQPSASLYALFDQVYIIAEGMCIFNGASESTVQFLASVGLQCPVYHNPADYILEVANCEYGNFNEALSKENLRHDWTKKSVVAYKSDENANNSPNKYNGKCVVPINKPSELYKFGVLYKRCTIQLYRDWTVTHLKIIVHVAIGVMMGLLYQDMGDDGSKTFNNLGFVMVSIAYLNYTSLMPAVLKFPQELPVIKKENFNNWYRLRTYYAAVLITSIPIQILFGLVYCAPSYFISGQPLDPNRFMKFVLICSILTLFADVFGNIIGTWVNPVNGTFLSAIITCGMIVYSGYVVLFSHMSSFMRTVSYGSFLRYAFEGLVLSLYADNRDILACPKDYCHYRHPKMILDTFSFTYDNYWIDVAILSSIVIIMRFIAFFTLKRSVSKSL